MKGAHPESTAPAWEFYDLEQDPGENHNAYNDPAYTEIIAEMKEELKALRGEVGDTDENRPVMQEIINNYWDE
jgi:hypothetical protein